MGSERLASLWQLWTHAQQYAALVLSSLFTARDTGTKLLDSR